MRLDKHKLKKEPSKHSQVLQKKAKEMKEQRKLTRKVKKDDSMDIAAPEAERTPDMKEADRLARKKANSHKVAVYKKMNFSLTNSKGHRAVR